jgi:nicotinamide-nucleotide amidase
MTAEIIAVGSELLTPDRVDTNSLYLTSKLNDLGVEVTQKTVIGDDRARAAAAVRASIERAGIVVLTGGLGPTEDDVTRDAVAAALGRGLEYRDEIWQGIRERFLRRGRVIPEINRRQAYVIEGSEPLPNANGTAPGLWIEVEGRVVLLLPGPPGEMRPMFEEYAIPRLKRVLPQRVLVTRVYRIALMPESEVDQRIAPVYTKYANPVTTILAAAGDIQVHLRAQGDDEAQAYALLDEVGEQIEAILGDRIYSRTGEPLEVVVGNLLRDRGETVSVAESATGGLLAVRITSVPGASNYFAGGFLVYNDRMKAALLGIPESMLKEHTAVSEPVAEAMAVAAQERTGSSYALSITGVAGPGGGEEKTPVGTVFIGIAGPDGRGVHRARFPGNRDFVRNMAAQTALDLLRRKLG